MSCWLRRDQRGQSGEIGVRVWRATWSWARWKRGRRWRLGAFGGLQAIARLLHDASDGGRIGTRSPVKTSSDALQTLIATLNLRCAAVQPLVNVNNAQPSTLSRGTHAISLRRLGRLAEGGGARWGGWSHQGQSSCRVGAQTAEGPEPDDRFGGRRLPRPCDRGNGQGELARAEEACVKGF